METYLNDFTISFRNDFAIFDTSISSSEIKPLHLGIPKIKKNLDTTTNEIKKDIIDSQKNNSLKNETKHNLDRNQTQKDIKPYDNNNDSKSSILNNAIKSFSEISKQPEKTPEEFSINCEYLIPMVQPNTFRGSIYVENISNTNTKLYLIPPNGSLKNYLLHSEININSKQINCEIFYLKSKVGEFYFGTDTIHCSFILNPFSIEGCAIMYNPSYNDKNHPRVFDFVIPALKKSKTTGLSQILPLSLIETSKLIEHSQKNSKEAIKLKSRIPISSNSKYDMTFDGKLLNNSLRNFILYHESSEKRDICTFSFVEDSKYNLTICYPLNITQGFIAVVASFIHLIH